MASQKKGLRSQGPPQTPTPPPGETTSGDTNTWSNGTNPNQDTTGRDNIRDSSPPPADRPREGEVGNTADHDRSAPGTVVGMPLGAARDSSSQLSMLMAELAVHKAALERAQRAEAAAKSRLEIARVEAAQSLSGAVPPDLRPDARVLGWVAQQHRPNIEEHGQMDPGPNASRFRNDNLAPYHDNPHSRHPYAPIIHRPVPELPPFDGNISEWIAFRAEFEDSAPMFSNVSNVSRIRKALRGEARIAVKAIMYTVTDPYEIMEALERHFGDPEEIVLTEIHNVKKMSRLAEDNSNIVTFAGHVANVVATIKALRQDKYLYAPELVNKIYDKLNLIVRYEWAKYKVLNQNLPDLVAMSNFLNEISSAARKTHIRQTKHRVNTTYENDHAESYRSPTRKHAPQRPRAQTNRRDRSSSSSDVETEQRAPHTVAKVHSKNKPAPPKPRTQHAAPPRESKQKCVMCNGEHKVSSCQQFIKASVSERWELARNSKLCYRCLESNHKRPIKCKYVPCGVNQCEAGHHKLMHGLGANVPSAHGNVSSINHIAKSNTYLKIVPIELSGPLGTVSTHALLDEGSTMTLIEREIADQIAPRNVGVALSIAGVGGHIVEDSESCEVKINIRGYCSRNVETMRARTIDKLNISTQEVSREVVEQCEHLRDIIDELCYELGTPTVLIGQDNWHLIVSRRVLSGKNTLPVASLTNLGWVLHGQYSAPPKKFATINHVKNVSTEDEALGLIKQHFSIESLGVESRVPKADPDQRALDILDATCHKIPHENRYQAGLLWRTENETLPDNRAHALRRLYSLENKLDKDAKLKEDYTAQIKNLLEKGYAEIANSRPPADAPRVWYLPHFPTTHPQKNKMRLVFDAAAKAYGRSLNDALLAGPDLLKSLFGVLIRFREGRIAVVADVKEMFLQVDVQEQDRDSLRFLWRGEDRTKAPQEFRMKRLIFGAASSPTIALYVKNKNAITQKSVYPVAAEKTIKNTYMDDMLIALDNSESEARQIVNEIYDLNKKASFELRGFASNNENVIRDVVASDTDSSQLGKSEVESTLGLKWYHKRDTIGFNVNLRNTPPEVLDGSKLPTKRQVTSSAMSIFDPIGYVSPISVLGKALMQEVWRTGVGWDETIPESTRDAWLSFINNIQQLRNIEIPRYVPATERKGELHTFCDASERIYAAAVYFVSKDIDGSKTSILVAAKARVAPLKTISIPRLELQSCVLGTRLTNAIVKETDYEITKRHFWSDSRTVLAWIKSDPRTYKSFVAHRLAEIEDTTTPADWRWVPSSLNVADDATRGVPTKFDNNHRWFYGPEFIRREPTEWPVEKPSTSSATPTGEERTVKAVCTVNCSTKNKFSYLPAIDRFSNYLRLLRATACVLVVVEVFKAKLSCRKHEIEMNRDHLKIAEVLLIQRSQHESFFEEIKALEAGRPIARKSPLHKIAVKLDRNGVIVLDSRTDRDVSIPVLHAKEGFTKLMIEHYHVKFNHGNHATVMNEIQQRYFIIGLRGSLRYISNRCQWCRTYKGTTLKVPVGDLPSERLKANQPPFTATAVDLFGPITVTIGRRHEKRWGVLYTCLTTRAVHLELAASLSAASMIMSLRRMMARRGTPTVIYSDNGTNFVGADRELKEARSTLTETIRTFASTRNIVWKRIPPGNPAAGGAWERMVGCIKAALKITLRNQAPTEEVLLTLLLEAEHIVNSRPLTPVNPNANIEALTPNHFLLGRSNAMNPFGSYKDEKLSIHSWKKTQALADSFWRRWVNEYRHTLSPRHNANLKTTKLSVGDVVIIADQSMPRGTWPKGVIAKTYPGPDGHVRVAEVQTRAGTVRRPASRLILICSANDLALTHVGETVAHS